ncbi:hypothetical protein HRbin06_00779 [archaeon HR06]|nr:hypothetical protein HRbin06_00779 [archaeon HR06]
MRRFRDRDFLLTKDGFFFCVVGNVHPKDKIISYLKYLPSKFGLWGRDNKYRRVVKFYSMEEYEKNLNWLKRYYPYYLFKSKVLGGTFQAVPLNFILKHFKPEERLKEIFRSKDLDPLEDKVLDLVNYLSKEANLNIKDFGVTGSLLIKIHNLKFSDIDLVIYGKEGGKKLKEALKGKLEIPEEHLKTLIRKRKLKPSITKEIYKRRWNYRFFEGKFFSIHPVKVDLDEYYGKKIYRPLGLAKVKVLIEEDEDSLFLPHKYGIKVLNFLKGKEVQNLKELCLYDGFYSILEKGEEVICYGKIEEVYDRELREKYSRIVIGSREAKGEDFALPLTLLL